MVHFIKLHHYSEDVENQDLILINPDNIAYIKSRDDGSSYIVFCCSAAKEYQYQYLSVMESLEEIEAIIKRS